jgi:uncharacterized Fe-S cluster-containing radical SAM superfamily protein
MNYNLLNRTKAADSRADKSTRYKRRRISKQAKIIIGFNCNNNCLFCYERTMRHLPDKTTTEVKKEISAACKRGFSQVHLMGGEPTIRPDVCELIEYAKDAGADSVMITSNGRMFAYPDFVKKIIKSGISQVVFSLHGHNAGLHDRLTGSEGSFKELIAGLENLKKSGFKNVGTNTVIAKQNYRYLPDIAHILAEHRIGRAEFTYVGIFKKALKLMKPRISLAAPYIRKALQIGKDRNYLWVVQNPPMGCYFEGYFKHLSWGKKEKKSLFAISDKNRSYEEVTSKKVTFYVKPEKCLGCDCYHECFGVEEMYLRDFGGREIKPIHKNV